MLYQCIQCGKQFIHPAKATTTLLSVTLTVPLSELDSTDPNATYNPSNTSKNDTLENHVCPFCNSKEYTEAPPEPTNQPTIENVYIYDLTIGPQTALDALLAQGYVIVSRFSKQYHLESQRQRQKTLSQKQRRHHNDR